MNTGAAPIYLLMDEQLTAKQYPYRVAALRIGLGARAVLSLDHLFHRIGS